ncbi:hypothetical protein LSH36_96g03024 [Paralvinella palmiformis]|uniref:Uncharacterized protein n=1 Tax=Paralvinella palmiformis TaxID=53620 RepID=A0AAD9NBY1_9ANNE|nr:hypothetical protein LSH36_96g03024 [Paralvinella palmiformis]
MASRSGRTVDVTNRKGHIKHLFAQVDNEDEVGERSDVSKELMNKLQIEHDVDASLRGVMRDLHDARMKQLRELQKDIAADNWRYTPIEKLIGLQ